MLSRKVRNEKNWTKYADMVVIVLVAYMLLAGGIIAFLVVLAGRIG